VLLGTGGLLSVKIDWQLPASRWVKVRWTGTIAGSKEQKTRGHRARLLLYTTHRLLDLALCYITSWEVSQENLALRSGKRNQLWASWYFLKDCPGTQQAYIFNPSRTGWKTSA